MRKKKKVQGWCGGGGEWKVQNLVTKSEIILSNYNFVIIAIAIIKKSLKCNFPPSRFLKFMILVLLFFN